MQLATWPGGRGGADLVTESRGPLRAAFSSADLPAAADERARFKLWHDIYCAHFGETDMAAPRDRPFSAEIAFLQIGEIGLTRFDATLSRWARTKSQVSANPRDDFLIGFNRSTALLPGVQGRHESAVAPGSAIFYTNDEPGESRPHDDAKIVGLCLPRARVIELVGSAEDMIGTVLTPNNPVTHHLGRYIEFLLACDDLNDDAAHSERIEALLLDLVALSLGAHRDVAHLARSRGLRAARIREILAAIETGFSDPGFSPSVLAAKLNCSPRYIQALLHETGTSFSERVLELRLQNARQLLMSNRHRDRKISDVALTSGFSNISYFNQAFRRRFGDSPSAYRNGAHD
jgi:AraC-like DNA-binding protein